MSPAGDQRVGKMRQQFGIAFDVRDPEQPATVDEAEAYVRRWAAFQDILLPVGLEPDIYIHEADSAVRGSFPSIQVSFEWEDGS